MPVTRMPRGEHTVNQSNGIPIKGGRIWEQTSLQIASQMGKVKTHSNVKPRALQGASILHRGMSQTMLIVERSLQLQEP